MIFVIPNGKTLDITVTNTHYIRSRFSYYTNVRHWLNCNFSFF